MSESQRVTPEPRAINAVLLAVRQAADVLCDRWTMSILVFALSGVSRFNDFRGYTGMASRQLTQRLQTLEAQGILIRMPYSTRPLRYGSHLTIMGQALFGAIACMVRWEECYGREHAGPVVRIAHRGCEAPSAAPQLVCVHCGAPVHAREVSGVEKASTGIRQLPTKKATYRRAAVSRRVAPALLPLPESMEIVGDKWTIEILVIVFMRIGSFTEIQRFSGVSSNVLSDRLGRLLRLGLLRQTAPGEAGRTGAYRITDKGVAFYPVLLAIQAWADEWLPDRLRSPLPLLHVPCGQPLNTAVACGVCGDTMNAANSDVSVDSKADL